MVKKERIKDIFIDSSAFIALSDPTDSIHNQAEKISKKLQGESISFYTATNVLLEAATILSQKLSHKEAVAFLELVRSGTTTILHPSEDLMFEAEIIFKKQTSKNVSYSDCISFAVMKEKNIQITFSFDQDYKKNGFTLIEDILKK